MTYTDPNLSPAERAGELLSRMTVAEKVAQLTGILPHALGAPDDVSQERFVEHLGQGIGHLCGVGTAAGSPSGIAGLANSVQRYLRESTRLAIPAIVHNEALNGVVAEGFSAFPTAIGLAATWDPDRVELMADLIRRQMRAAGIHQALSPVLDVARDARWGRVHETYGEDVLLASAFGVSYVRGLQGDDLLDGVIATAKHFVGYSATESGQNMAATHLGPRELFDVHAAPFEAAIRLAGLQSVMNSYSEIDGQPVATSREVLTDLLRGRLGFEGTVVSDYRSLFYVVQRQRAGDTASVGAAALRAGLDVELPAPYAYGEELIAGIESGAVPSADLDLAVHRTLTHKFALGLFENPFVDDDPIVVDSLASSGRDLSRMITDESITLLKNDGVLPLTDDGGSIAVLGPHADSVMSGFGNYSYPPFLETLRAILSGRSRMAGMEQALSDPDPAAQERMRARMEAISRLDPERMARESYDALSLSQALAEALPRTEITTAPGTGVLDAESHDIPAALALASAADVVVLAIGGRSVAFAGRATEGEGSDSATIELPARQVELVREVAKLGKPVIAVVYMGKPYALAAIEPLVDAIVTGYIPGPEGGRSLAAVISGSAEPSGRLPFTIPRHVGQVPLYHAQKPGSGQRRLAADQFTEYVDLENSPLYPFGHGLSYTAFERCDLSAEVDADGDGGVDGDGADVLRVELTVRNVGDRAGTDVVQVYVSPPAFTITRPERQLSAFARVELAPGEAARVRFRIDVRQLGYTCEDGRFVVDPGEYGVRVGSSSEDLPLTATVAVGGARREIETPHAYLPAADVSVLARATEQGS
ncbi:glycoside hydrolase family 3 N-terminal domain-containing protein [Microbacterium sp. APC 3901]|uniref:beta-glucosidase family protein n=1 Tax=Microbacterium sp. APC 3901 TaxID=3035192 RepID=UPI0025B3FB9B|nr:glycoside hydrolase family 3 N-terminal domain-containing protein [Microbacterium sp. APC 3901]MDN3444126.1 glycoside hydrolase family 3 N-terminal domain-containing protein [Microbacterium sp. APC 3901]